MPKLKLIKYPGSKSVLIPEINKIFIESGSKMFVDVFGGSGIVSLNVQSDRIVYNDLNRELFNLFKAIQLRRDDFQQKLERITSSKDLFIKYGESLEGGKCQGSDDVEKAFASFYKFNVGFGGMGETYSTINEKSTFTWIKKILSQFPIISSRVGKWKLENLNFIELVRKYDRHGAFLYFDPPYIGKDWYEFNFSKDDLYGLKKIIEGTKGKYLLNLNYEDKIASNVLGHPRFIKKYVNQNVKKETSTEYRFVSFYTNVV